MGNKHVHNDYFMWLCETVDYGSDFNEFKYSRLLGVLHDIDFVIPINIPTIANDANRVSNGENLRWHYVCDGGSRSILGINKPCSVLELIIGLAMDFESIVDDADIDCSTRRWFWMMIENLDLKHMTNEEIDIERIYDVIETFMYRRYSSDGSNGGLIVIPRCHINLTTIELWNQMCLYLDEMI